MEQDNWREIIMKYKVTIIEEHVIELTAERPEEAGNAAEWIHDDAEGQFYANSWIEKVEELEE